MKLLHIGWGYWSFRYGGLMNYVEDLMDAQVASGDRVTYFCAGRHYPLLSADHLHRWSRRGIAMREIINSSLRFAAPTRNPDDDLHHAPSERHFATVLEEVSPDVVHIHELVGLPSSIIDLTRAAEIPVIATLQDYGTLCPSSKLYEVDGQLCRRHDVGESLAAYPASINVVSGAPCRSMTAGRTSSRSSRVGSSERGPSASTVWSLTCWARAKSTWSW